ncbi:MAG: hypothetical protein QXR45_13720 [Candidatus Bathyarchaeia archaeon]
MYPLNIALRMACMGVGRKDTADSDDIRKAIYLIDSYRANLFYDITWIDKKVAAGKLGNRFRKVWKNLRKTMIKMASVTNEQPDIRNLVKIQNYLEILWQICVPVVIIIMFLSILTPKIVPFAKGLTVYLVGGAFSSIILGLIGRFIIGGKIGRKIDEYFAKNPEAHKFKKREVREAVQLLIEDLRVLLRTSNKDPRKHLIGLNFLDYDNIRVVKKPKPWRKYYLAEIIL